MKFRTTGVSEGGEGRGRKEDEHPGVPAVLVLCLRLEGEFMWVTFTYIWGTIVINIPSNLLSIF